jgi:hypothetical protein
MAGVSAGALYSGEYGRYMRPASGREFQAECTSHISGSVINSLEFIAVPANTSNCWLHLDTLKLPDTHIISLNQLRSIAEAGPSLQFATLHLNFYHIHGFYAIKSIRYPLKFLNITGKGSCLNHVKNGRDRLSHILDFVWYVDLISLCLPCSSTASGKYEESSSIIEEGVLSLPAPSPAANPLLFTRLSSKLWALGLKGAGHWNHAWTVLKFCQNIRIDSKNYFEIQFQLFPIPNSVSCKNTFCPPIYEVS